MDEDAIPTAIERLLTDDELHVGCTRIGVDRAKVHHWSTVAGKVFSELDRIARSR